MADHSFSPYTAGDKLREGLANELAEFAKDQLADRAIALAYDAHIEMIRGGMNDPRVTADDDPAAEVRVELYVHSINEPDHCEGFKWALSEMIAADATEGDQGYHVAVMIRALENSISKLKEKVAAEGWPLTTDWEEYKKAARA